MDNRDSFVFTLVQYLRELGADCTVRGRADVRPGDADGAAGVLVSPGPGHPADPDAGACLALLRRAAGRGTPVLGVCLGHQMIAHVFGARVARAPEIVHGATSRIRHDGRGVFSGLPDAFPATRYHSLAVVPETVPQDVLEVSARTADGVVMGLRHVRLPVEGVQFHPESVLSAHGHDLLGNWLAACRAPAVRT
ncbi:anthranilate synthase component II [Actinomadura parmotrematis]|uniref:anthranilate synthase component II n=1 Tax=Actinomadura parmotrematis TaxID=2864039 RepID=UPI0027E28BF1|nr:aminodeoxychorismate/anthranilate synthase component II [Actinomadura parmotrematis]